MLDGKTDDHEWLKEFIRIWKGFKDVFVKFCLRIFGYLDKYFVVLKEVRPLRDEAQFIYFSVIFDKNRAKLTKIILHFIKEERNLGLNLYNDIIKESIYLFKEMDQYGRNIYQDLDNHIAKESRIYFNNQSDLWINNNSIPEYLSIVELKVKEETKRLEIIYGFDNQNLIYCLDELISLRCNRIFEDVRLIEKMIIEKDVESKSELTYF